MIFIKISSLLVFQWNEKKTDEGWKKEKNEKVFRVWFTLIFIPRTKWRKTICFSFFFYPSDASLANGWWNEWKGIFKGLVQKQIDGVGNFLGVCLQGAALTVKANFSESRGWSWSKFYLTLEKRREKLHTHAYAVLEVVVVIFVS